MKAYKGFHPDMTCRGYKYVEGEEHVTDRAEICNCGFHACTDPLDVLDYYNEPFYRYHEVDVKDTVTGDGDDSKVCGKRLTVGKSLGFDGLCREIIKHEKEKYHEVDEGESVHGYRGGVEVVRDHLDVTHFKASHGLVLSKKDYGKVLVSGDRSAARLDGICCNVAVTGHNDHLVLNGDYCYVATTGTKNVITSTGSWTRACTVGESGRAFMEGDLSVFASCGEKTVASASGRQSVIAIAGSFSRSVITGETSRLSSGGDHSRVLSTGDYSRVITCGESDVIKVNGRASRVVSAGNECDVEVNGDNASVHATGFHSRVSSSGEGCLVSSVGRGGMARASLGSWITLADWKFLKKENKWVVKKVVSRKVDGVKVKAGTWYKLENGKLVEVGS